MGYVLSEKDKQNPDNEVLQGSPDFKVSDDVFVAIVFFVGGTVVVVCGIISFGWLLVPTRFLLGTYTVLSSLQK